MAVREIEMVNKFTTSDIAHAAYLMLKGLKLLSATREIGGKFKFEFDDAKGNAKDLVMEYVTSDFSSFDNHLKNLKKLLY